MRKDVDPIGRATKTTIEPHLRKLNLVWTLYRLRLANIKDVEIFKALLADELPLGLRVDDVDKLFRHWDGEQIDEALSKAADRQKKICSDPETTRMPTSPIKISA